MAGPLSGGDGREVPARWRGEGRLGGAAENGEAAIAGRDGVRQGGRLGGDGDEAVARGATENEMPAARRGGGAEARLGGGEVAARRENEAGNAR